ncbi:hypothetical protein G7Y89_g9246 [Cudoniella acicularis]|uniref:Uncharacterized protein n=1 Tax=Cudoniella acicularis TaxID=354080 RepID=A0A8H4RF19_9HELO|nr:hypothetical protein G7Y89_g9246 [Cudoniella acicularis]
MDSIPTPSSAINRERGFSASHAVSPRAGVDRDVVRNGGSVRRPEENRPPATIPKAFESMLKTTTETGDIGMFSIKPSRVPPPVNSPRRLATYSDNNITKPQQVFQPYGVPSVDDRRRLPSYSRDPASELISMYQTPSQKSSRVFDDPDYRSFSMTQTSSYTLSNHRSYTSLRSQPEGNGLLQRPRSPFAYPTRLKRPGFRPSSPALTDGGGVDYRRRAEIDRTPYGAGHSTSSPSSLYAQKRMPPYALRSEANRSTPSLLSQPSPPRRSSSPLVPQSNGTIGQDWPRRNGLASVNTSPARSTFSLSSTVNLFPTYLPPSTTTTPGKPQPASPLYYDYTEDFEVDDYTQQAAREPPPQFRMAETIPEDCAMNSERPSLVDTNTRNATASLNSGVRISSSSASIHQVSVHEAQDHNGEGPAAEPRWPVRKASLGAQNGVVKSSVNLVGVRKEKNNLQRPVLIHGTQELNDHVEEAFGLSSPVSLNLLGSKHGKGLVAPQPEDFKMANGIKGSREQASAGPALNGTTEHTTQVIGLPQSRTSSHPSSAANTKKNEPFQERENHSQKPRKHAQPSLSPHPPGNKSGDRGDMYNQKRSSSVDFTTARPKRARSSGFNSIDTGFTDLAELISSLESANRSRSAADTNEVPIIPPERLAMVSPTIPDQLISRRESSNHSITPPLSAFNSQSSEGVQVGSSKHQAKRTQGHQRARHAEPNPGHCASQLPEFSSPMPRKSVSRSGSPMIAPKPISPARQLKLKNSVPQLMKALPPLPPDGPTKLGPPPVEPPAGEETEMPCHFSLLLPENNSTSIKDTLSSPKSSQISNGESSNQVDVSAQRMTFATSVSHAQDGSVNPQSPPRMKLKLRNSVIYHQSSPHDSRPWNSEENYPWSNQNPSIRLPSLIQSEKPGNMKPSKFKLKASHLTKSTQETVRVNRENGESKPPTGLHLRNPKDLFTPVSGMDNIFRQVGKHLHSRKSSSVSSHPGRESSPAPMNQNTIRASVPEKSQGQSSETSRLAVVQANSSEVRSFFSDDNSNAQGRHSLRKRFSNLRARIVVPYATRSGVQSCDDITFNGRNLPEDPRPFAARSVPNLHDSIETDSEDMALRRSSERVHRLRLKEKLSRWLKGARSAIAARVRSLSLSGKGDDGKA